MTGEIWALPRGNNSAEPPEPRGGVADLDQAEEFLELFHAENPAAGPLSERVRWVRAEFELTGTYRHTSAELEFGARVAWRNSARCIGRLYWRSMRVRDLRAVRAPAEVAEQCVEHLRIATNGGKVRPLITIFAPDAPDAAAPRIWNEQLIRYAGHRLPDGTVLGDPRYVEFTDAVRDLGWAPDGAPGAFDVLPLVVSGRDDGTVVHPLPRDAVHEVELRHPDHPWFAELGLRWHAVPAISSMRLSIGGIDYPAAPFNGWYMSTEIGARNLADHDRFDLLPTVAQRLGLDTGRETSLWRDRALVEVNVAVLHSFAEAGVAITDHHTESARFLTHVEREEKAGRTCPADWSWIVPPMSGGITPVFHRYYDTEALRPEFVADESATRTALSGVPPVFPEPTDGPIRWSYPHTPLPRREHQVNGTQAL
ncbi:nitric-oxide synthase [Actinokineospora alba]|uniref:Nitric-oxide synthase n=1 Tax=Actinokineospora alba TaxID=504798 RepID=A0A1H0WE03_9PSEU|nr:nitric oxide synthase oxygenase [Actinokineospora alba]TDP68903.1 nitric-oxide synthase [Actinokineospora alba]SDI74790.1 nitric-oxide synthase [Actinokineospora alba]SDP88960.1 nitric-oxide synthase [Actinokineospora alba]